MAFDPDAFVAAHAAKNSPHDELALLARSAAPMGHDPGMLESLGRGFEQGATFGFGDEINGGLEALLDKLKGTSKEDFLTNYEKHRDESRQLFKNAEEANPWTSGAGNLLGGGAALLATGGGSLVGEGALGAAALGAGTGALTGLGNSEAKDASGMAKDALVGGGLGGTVGGAVGLASPYVGKGLTALGKGLKSAGAAGADILAATPLGTALTSFKQGLVDNRGLVGKGANAALNDEINSAVTGLGDKVQGLADAAGANKKAALEGAEGAIDLMPWYRDFTKATTNLQNKYDYNPKVTNDIADVRELVSNFIHGDAEKGIVGRGVKISAPDLEEFARTLGQYGSKGDDSLTSSEGKALVNRLIAPLNRAPKSYEDVLGLPNSFKPLFQMVKEAAPGVGEENSSISTLLNALKSIPDEEKVSPTVGYLAGVQKTLEGLPEEQFGGDLVKLKNLQQAREIATKIKAPGLNQGLISETGKGALYGLPNTAGLATRGLYEMLPEQLQTLSEKLASQGSDAATQLAKVISEANTRDKLGRNALLFAAQQNPKYRELLRQMEGSDKKVP